MSVTFADRLFKLRKQHKLSQTELGNRVNLGQNTISQYEKGLRKPEVEIVSKLAQYFGVTIDYLHGLSNTPELSALEEKKKMRSKATLKQIRDLIASGEVEGIDEDSIDDIVKYLDDKMGGNKDT